MIGGMPSAPAAAPEEALVSPGAVALRGARLRTALVPFLALFTSLVFCALLLLVAGHNPLTVYHALWSGAVTGQSAFANTLVSTTPYILLGLMMMGTPLEQARAIAPAAAPSPTGEFVTGG